MSDFGPYITAKELSELVGCFPTQITEAYLQGRISDNSCKWFGKRRRYHKDLALADFKRTRAVENEGRKKGKTLKQRINTDTVIENKVPPIVESKSIQAAYQARIAKIDFEEKSGRLVDGKSLEKKIFGLARLAREKLLSIPDRVSSLLASETDPIEVHKELEKEINKALEDIQDIAL